MTNQTKKSKQRPVKNFLKYSALAFQMGAIIFIGCWGGMKLDEMYPNEHKMYMIICSLLGVGIALYTSLKGLIKSSDD